MPDHCPAVGRTRALPRLPAGSYNGGAAALSADADQTAAPDDPRKHQTPARRRPLSVRAKRASEDAGPVHSSLVPSERLGGTAADARIRGTTSAGFRKAIARRDDCTGHSRRVVASRKCADQAPHGSDADNQYAETAAANLAAVCCHPVTRRSSSGANSWAALRAFDADLATVVLGTGTAPSWRSAPPPRRRGRRATARCARSRRRRRPGRDSRPRPAAPSQRSR